MAFFKKTAESGTIPTKGTSDSAGYDLYSTVDITIVGGEGMVLIPTCISAQLPPGTYGSIRPRSGLAYKHHINVGGGVIDRDYFPNPIGVLLYCVKNGYKYEIKAGDRIAQLVIEKISNEGSVSGNKAEVNDGGVSGNKAEVNKAEVNDKWVSSNEVSNNLSTQSLSQRNGGFGSTGV